MTKEEMLQFVQKNVTLQGNQGAINITPLLFGIIEQLYKEPITGVAPIVVKLCARGEKIGTRTTYEITTPQPLIDAYISSAFEKKELTRLFVEDNGALLGFNLVEIDELSITGKAVLYDGEIGLVLTKDVGRSYFYHDEKIVAIPQTTEGEIEAYKAIFGATYDKVENVYKLVVGATEFALTPGEMLIVNEEYNKTSTDGNYTAMWANSISRYICCAPWFSGFPKFKLHSAFFSSKDTIFIDLNTPVLPVSDLTNAFAGCERLEQISGIIEVDERTILFDTFKGCKTLRVFKMHNLSSNLDLSECPNLAYEVFEELLTYCADRPITIYVHANVDYNIKNVQSWADVKGLLAQKANVNIVTR